MDGNPEEVHPLTRPLIRQTLIRSFISSSHALQFIVLRGMQLTIYPKVITDFLYLLLPLQWLDRPYLKSNQASICLRLETFQVIAFSDEEGVRFQSTFLGSAAVAGILPASALHFSDKRFLE